MCRLVAEAAARAGAILFMIFLTFADIPYQDERVIADARRIVGEPHDSNYIPSEPKEFASRIFHTCYMGTENSSIETRRRAKQLAHAIGRSVVRYYADERFEPQFQLPRRFKHGHHRDGSAGFV
jgi:NAD+ synthase (glutamine-hydrolysing)